MTPSNPTSCTSVYRLVQSESGQHCRPLHGCHRPAEASCIENAICRNRLHCLFGVKLGGGKWTIPIYPDPQPGLPPHKCSLLNQVITLSARLASSCLTMGVWGLNLSCLPTREPGEVGYVPFPLSATSGHWVSPPSHPQTACSPSTCINNKILGSEVTRPRKTA